ncbi:hypothetical protein Cadr_000024103 [Camelus dromedarius]|uniref:Uncharacterized protein n=1 Tax=Camelus dromedarius TaxID=9838 RepID=A0A5N4CXA6_CAMDR|nr:hypothetical protein Cadr_000024103 [Camelus dromedarius]
MPGMVVPRAPGPPLASLLSITEASHCHQRHYAGTHDDSPHVRNEKTDACRTQEGCLREEAEPGAGPGQSDNTAVSAFPATVQTTRNTSTQDTSSQQHRGHFCFSAISMDVGFWYHPSLQFDTSNSRRERMQSDPGMQLPADLASRALNFHSSWRNGWKHVLLKILPKYCFSCSPS